MTAIMYEDTPVATRAPETEIEPILSLASVVPIRQPIRLGETIHYMRPLAGFGVLTQAEIERDWNLYRELNNRVSGGGTLTNDEALIGDLACERLLRFSLPTIDEAEWETIDGFDKQALITFFFEITRLTENLRKDARARLPMRSISPKSGQN